MRLKREQKRWIRRHRGLLITIGILGIIIIAAFIYIYLLLAGMISVPDFLNRYMLENPVEDITQEDQTKPNVYEENTTSANDGSLTPNPVELTEPASESVEEYTVPENTEYPYYIKVNRIMNCVTIYGIDENGEYTIPVKAMVCSVGKNDGDTPLDISQTSDMYEFHPMVDGTYAQYAYRFNTGGILFHSVPYHTMDKSDLETDQFNLLGSPASLGCVRLCVRDALWLQQNCPAGTTVEVYDDTTTPGPLGKPEMIKIPLDSPYAGWDPTDPDEANPWYQFHAAISGAQDITISAGTAYDPMSGITAADTCGNDITDRIIVTGVYDCNTPGKYEITYQVTDAIESTDVVTIQLTVAQ
jgi:lipoprotein-anchoring transpeptidase ErfK/SrfK